MNYIFRLTLLLVVPFLAIPLLLIMILIRIDSRGPILFWSKRVGQHEEIFLMPKFRTMKIDTPQLATHLLDNHKDRITAIGKFLRKFSLDEIPQFYSILKGDMNLIGPRPALFNQKDLIKLRRKYKLNNIKPGLTGWAQVNGRDTISIEKKVILESFYEENKNLFFDIKIILMTLIKVVFIRDILH